MNANRIWFADLLRGVAALAVVLSHLTTPYWASIGSQPLVMGLLGQFGVGLFFLISGFLVPISLQNLGAARFLAGRAFRIYPTYIAGFSISLALFSVFNPGGLPFKDTVGHYLLVQDILGTKSLDGVIWTLQIEIKFYLLCAAFAPLVRRFSPGVGLVGAAILAFGLAAPNTIYGAEACWLALIFIGVVYNWHCNSKLSTIAAVAIGSLLLAGFAYAWLIRLGGGRPELLLAYASAQLVFLLAYIARRHVRPIALLRWMSAISYPLYVMHVVLGGVVANLVLAATGSPLLGVSSAVLACLAVATVLHVAVERPTHRFGRRLVSRRTAPTAASPALERIGFAREVAAA